MVDFGELSGRMVLDHSLPIRDDGEARPLREVLYDLMERYDLLRPHAHGHLDYSLARQTLGKEGHRTASSAFEVLRNEANETRARYLASGTRGSFDRRDFWRKLLALSKDRSRVARIVPALHDLRTHGLYRSTLDPGWISAEEAHALLNRAAWIDLHRASVLCNGRKLAAAIDKIPDEAVARQAWRTAAQLFDGAEVLYSGRALELSILVHNVPGQAADASLFGHSLRIVRWTGVVSLVVLLGAVVVHESS